MTSIIIAIILTVLLLIDLTNCFDLTLKLILKVCYLLISFKTISTGTNTAIVVTKVRTTL